jgi:hypothetical protein
MTDKPVISDAEKRAFLVACRANPDTTYALDALIGDALSAFLLARVPEMRIPRLPPYDNPMRLDTHEDGFNACREQVLRGKG